jgi:hypothetical protein
MEAPKKRRRRSPKKYDRHHYFVSEEDKKEIYGLYNLGWHPQEMSVALKISDKTIYKYCKEMFSPPGGWRRGFIGSAEERSIRLAVRKGMALTDVCNKFKRPMWIVWPLIAPASGLGAIGPQVPNPGEFFEVTTHEYIKRIGEDPAPSLGQRIKSFFGRVFRGSN